MPPVVAAVWGATATTLAAFRGETRAPRKAPTIGNPAQRAHVLVVDDTQEILDLLRELLEEEGYRVSVSLETLDLTRIKALQPDVIVQEVLAPGVQGTGWKFLTLSQLDPVVARIPLILCTTAVETVKDPAMAENLDRLGVRVLLKPFDLSELLATLEDILAAQALICRVRAGQERGASGAGGEA